MLLNGSDSFVSNNISLMTTSSTNRNEASFGNFWLDIVSKYSRGGDLVSTLPGCVCRKMKDMGPFSASSE